MLNRDEIEQKVFDEKMINPKKNEFLISVSRTLAKNPNYDEVQFAKYFQETLASGHRVKIVVGQPDADMFLEEAESCRFHPRTLPVTFIRGKIFTIGENSGNYNKTGITKLGQLLNKF